MTKEDKARFWGQNHLTTRTNTRKAVDFINDFDSEKKDFTLADIVEIYNVSKFWKILSKEEKKKLNKKFMSSASKKIKDYFDNNPLCNMDSDYRELNSLYQRDFWKMFLMYKREEVTAIAQLQAFISDNNVKVVNLISKETSECDAYNKMVKELLFGDPRLVKMFLEKENSFLKVDYKFPKIFTNQKLNSYVPDSEINAWVARYCDLPDAEEECLYQIATWSEKQERKFDDKTKAAALKVLVEKHSNADNRSLGSEVELKYFPSVNQSHEELFEALISELGFNRIPGCFSLIRGNSRQEFKKTKYSYSINLGFSFNQMACLQKLKLISDFLSNDEMEIEDILAFNYKELIKRKLAVEGFEFKPTTKGADYYDKIKGLNPEMERILKYYSIYQQYGVVDKYIFSVRSYNPDFRDLKSLSDKKFVYAHADDVLVFCNLLFHNDTDLSVLRSEDEPSSFYEYVKSGAKIADLDEYKKDVFYGNPYFKNLFDVDDSGQIFFKDVLKIGFYKTLWEYGYYPLFYASDSLLQFIDIEEKLGKLEYKNTLFSKQESNYISYMLDTKIFDNGPDIRNRGAHGMLPNNDSITCEVYYLKLLIIFLLYTIRINEELEHQNKKRITEGDADCKH